MPLVADVKPSRVPGLLGKEHFVPRRTVPGLEVYKLGLSMFDAQTQPRFKVVFIREVHWGSRPLEPWTHPLSQVTPRSNEVPGPAPSASGPPEVGSSAFGTESRRNVVREGKSVIRGPPSPLSHRPFKGLVVHDHCLGGWVRKYLHRSFLPDTLPSKVYTLPSFHRISIGGRGKVVQGS